MRKRLWKTLWLLLLTAWMIAGCTTGKDEPQNLHDFTETTKVVQQETAAQQETIAQTQTTAQMQQKPSATDVAKSEEPDRDQLTEETTGGENGRKQDTEETTDEETDQKQVTEGTTEGVPDKDGAYTTKEDVALYLYTYGVLPKNFLTKKQAKNKGWQAGGLDPYVDGGCIGGDSFGNFEGILPSKKGRRYYECDIDTMHQSRRGAKRIVFSNDGLIYYTEDHYSTFELLYEDAPIQLE